MKKHPKKDKSANAVSDKILIWNIAFIAFVAIVLMAYTSVKFKEINLKLSAIIEANSKKDVVEKKTKATTEKTKKTTKSKK